MFSIPCAICGRQLHNAADHALHELACETAAQEEVRQCRAALAAAVVKHENRCHRCGGFHLFSSEDEACQIEDFERSEAWERTARERLAELAERIIPDANA